MTKYLLHGGKTSLDNKSNDGFYMDLVGDVRDGGTILLNFYAKPRKTWDELFEWHKMKILSYAKGKRINFEVAQRKKLILQLKKCDQMYMRGGEPKRLVKFLKQFPSLEKYFSEKTISGASAGAYALSKYYYNNDTGQINEGVGLLDIKTIVHYDHTFSKAVEKLSKHKKELPLVLLPECKWVKIIK